MEFNLFGKAKYKLVLVKKKANGDYEKVRTANFQPSDSEKRISFGSFISPSEHRLYTIDVSNICYRTEKNTHFLFVDIDTGDTLNFKNLVISDASPVDRDGLNATKLAKVAMNQVSGNFGLMIPILCIAIGGLAGFLLGQNWGSIIGGS